MHTVQVTLVFANPDNPTILDFQCRKFVPQQKQITDLHWKSKSGLMRQELPILAIVSRVHSDTDLLLILAV